MSAIQVANIFFESTQNNTIKYIGSNTVTFTTAGTETMRIDPANVAIGTSASKGQVHISGTNQNTTTLTDTGGRGGMIRLSDFNASQGAGGGIIFTNSQGDTANSIGFAAIKGYLLDGSGNTAGDISFYTRTGSLGAGLVEKMRIGANGNVGIACTAPGSLVTIYNNSSSANTDWTAATPATLEIYRDWAATANEQPVSRILFTGRSSLGAKITHGSIESTIRTVGTNDGVIYIRPTTAGGTLTDSYFGFYEWGNWFQNKGGYYIGTYPTNANGSTYIEYYAVSNTAGPTISFERARTNGTAELAVASGDTIGNYRCAGSNGTAYVSAGSIQWYADAAFTGAAGTSHAGIVTQPGGEAVRWDSVGFMYLNCTAPFTTGYQGQLNIYSPDLAGTAHCIAMKCGQATTGANYKYISFLNNVNTQAGTIYLSASAAVTYQTTSDYRLKTNMQPITGALDRIMKLKPVSYDWIGGGEHDEGFIAHELQEHVPLIVGGEKDAVNKDGTIKPQSIDYGKLVVQLTAALQELKAEFDAYKATHP